MSHDMDINIRIEIPQQVREDFHANERLVALDPTALSVELHPLTTNTDGATVMRVKAVTEKAVTEKVDE